ncbi:TPA: hypothetical protein QCI13_004835 [Enterobacter ludwigii]|nr:hypothetical protein [Enterobacter ludwigii]
MKTKKLEAIKKVIVAKLTFIAVAPFSVDISPSSGKNTLVSRIKPLIAVVNTDHKKKLLIIKKSSFLIKKKKSTAI